MKIRNLALLSLDEEISTSATPSDTTANLVPAGDRGIDSTATETPSADNADVKIQELDVVLEELGEELEQCEKLEIVVQAAPSEELNPVTTGVIQSTLEAQAHRIHKKVVRKPSTGKHTRGLGNKAMHKVRAMEAIQENKAHINKLINKLVDVRTKKLKG